MELNTLHYNIKFSDFILLTIFIILPFLMGDLNLESAELLHITPLPSFVTKAASTIRWILFVFITIYVFFHITHITKAKGVQIIYMLCFFYVIQFIYALASNSDIFRYLGLTIISFSLPLAIGKFYYISRCNILEKIKLITYFLLVLNILFGFNSLNYNMRFQGFVNNPNTYGIIALFWLTILLLPTYNTSKKKNIINNLFVFICIFTIIATGSRAAFIGVIIILFSFFYMKGFKTTLLLVSLILIGLMIMSNFIDLPYLDRLGNIGLNNVDEARKDLWETSMYHIKNNLWFGNGMDAPIKLINTGNIHNCYLRYLLTMGLFFTLLSFLFYFIFFMKILRSLKKVPNVLIGFVFAYTVMNIVEDYYMGIGSSAFLSFLIIVGFIITYINQYYYLNLIPKKKS